jgi:hypothetical protein
MSCVAVCPAVGALDLTMGVGKTRSAVPPFALAAGVVVLFCGIVGFAMWSGYWHTSLPDGVYFDLIPRASQFAHPR